MINDLLEYSQVTSKEREFNLVDLEQVLNETLINLKVTIEENDALQAQLDLLIRDPAVRRQIQVRNVDRLAYSIVKETRGTPVIADERVLRARWAEAAAAFGLDLTPAFLKNEWEQVILAQDLRNEHAYLTCLRTGRGRPLTKAQRSRVWQAAQQVTAELATARQTTHLQLANEATHLLREAGAPRYRHILVDEAQDLHPAQWRLLRAAVAEGPDDLFIAADPHQRIYSSRASLASLRISVRGRSRKLSLNYRTTQEILAWAMPLLGSDPVTGLDGEADSLLGYRSPMHGQQPAGPPRRHPRRGIRFPFRTDPFVAGGRPRAGRHRGYGQIRRPGAGGPRGTQSGWPRHHLDQRPARCGGRPGRHHARHEGPGVPGRRGDRRRGRRGPGPHGHHRERRGPPGTRPGPAARALRAVRGLHPGPGPPLRLRHRQAEHVPAASPGRSASAFSRSPSRPAAVSPRSPSGTASVRLWRPTEGWSPSLRHWNSSATSWARSCPSKRCSGCWRGPKDGRQDCSW